jgi:hypothetical protein
MICEKCGKDKPNCGPFKDDTGKRWEKMCGGCKLHVTMTNPNRRRDLEDFGRKLGVTLQLKTGEK